MIKAVIYALVFGFAVGCATRTRVVIIPADREVIALRAGQPFTPPGSGYWVPAEAMRMILERGLLETNSLPR